MLWVFDMQIIRISEPKFTIFKASSCKVYGVVPPPHQLLVGVQSSGNELNVKTSSNPCLTSSDGSSTPTPLVSSFDFVNVIYLLVFLMRCIFGCSSDFVTPPCL
ncbi:hypothetical protein AAG906_001480 [Vitis piasezkii]